ncbi:DUF1190 domain-containing protein [Oryzicola mucosus]|uniref:DUF1190 domain-containing protein n=1 Tax=Oryzicola mucosus TaxID=2767425 RepID=UPI001E610DFF|nr:DUF1190 domain-containing protein [Oryzicola mucosus]
MKRSLAVTLVVMGTAAGVAGCQDQVIDTAVYQSVDECIDARMFAPEKCEADFKQAAASHEKTAPAFASKEDCEADFGAGQCAQPTQQHSAGSGVFLPLMMGYMLGSAMNNNANVGPQALYRQNGRADFVNGNGARVAGATGPVKFSSNSPAARPPAVQTQTMARGGFGSRAVAVSS